MPLDVEKLRWVGFTTSLFRTLTEEAKNSTRESIARGIFRQTLLAAGSPQQQKSLLEQHLLQQISAVLRIPAAEIDNQVPLIDMGMDSLMALELRNRVEATLGLKLSATLLWNYPTMAALTPYLVRRMNITLGIIDQSRPESSGNDGNRQDLTSVLTEVEHLSEEKIDEFILVEGSHLSEREIEALLAETADLPADD